MGVGYVERCGATQRMRRRHRLTLERRPCCCCACALSAGAAVGELPAFLIAPYGRKRWGAAFRCMKGSSTCSCSLKLSNRKELFTSMPNWHPAPVHRAGHSISSRGCLPLLVGGSRSQWSYSTLPSSRSRLCTPRAHQSCPKWHYSNGPREHHQSVDCDRHMAVRRPLSGHRPAPWVPSTSAPSLGV